MKKGIKEKETIKTYTMESIKSHQRWHHTLNLFHWWLYVIRFSFISIVISGIKSIWDPLLREQDKENRNQTQNVYPWHQRTTAKNAFCCTSHGSSLNPSEIKLFEWWQCANNVSCTAVSRLIFCQWKTLYMLPLYLFLLNQLLHFI